MSEVWIHPSFGAWKFNLDGSARGKPGPSGIGGVIRDFRVQVLGLFSSFVGIQDSNTAKACMLCASSLALRNKKITIVSDSKIAVSWVNDKTSIGSLKHVNLIYDIRC
ncbi:hypothetical protein Dsin_003634 [Dipteronia sinensis]|uniref:RNase H type-1 domain-containing protein n=1 Tax=Dipteronia sinensis TaxID=43782 RepID=A0AAE0B9A6_9ROSI|nr:hypothetical protein Dsin_003634 [Dipteronia sinensis]